MLYLRQFCFQLMLIIIIVYIGISFNAYSETLINSVKDNEGNPVADAVVSASLLSGKADDTMKIGTIDQLDKEFVPYVLPVQIGTAVDFPNNDEIRHHVYSFSPVKLFELPLYPPGKGGEQFVVFDKPGVVVLGCNIHDWMKAYVYVLETPLFAKTDANGQATIANLPPGEYDVQVWHPRIDKASEEVKQRITVAQGSDRNMEFTIMLKREWRAMRAPKAGGGIYR